MPRSKSSRQWLKEHFADAYVKEAKAKGYRSRAAFKLIELQKRYQLFKRGMVVVDLGAAPGSWSQVVKEYIGDSGQVFAVDLLPMEALPGVNILQGDFTEQAVLDSLFENIGQQKIDWVLSDMAPNTSGIDSVDQPRSIYLAELALDCAKKILKINGSFLVKVFQGEGFDHFLKEVKENFKKVSIQKPKASRDRSKEVYILATNLK